MMNARLVVAVLLAACGGKKDDAVTKTPDPTPGSGSGSTVAAKPEPAPAPTDAPPCPTGDALLEKAAKLFGVKRDAMNDATCAAGHFPHPAWALNARYTATNGEGMITERDAMIDPAGKILLSDETEQPPGVVDSSGTTSMQAIDFDHDGIDELVSVFSSDKRGYMQSSLDVAKFAKGKWQHAFDRQFSYDNSAAEPPGGVISCESSWKITEPDTGGKRTIVLEPKTKAKSEECIPSKETWVLGADGKFAKK